MINLDDLQTTKTPTSAKQTNTLAPVTTDQLLDILFKNTVQTILTNKPDDNSKDSQVAAYRLAQQLDNNGTQALVDRIKALHLSYTKAQESGDADLLAATNLSAQYVMTFIRRLVSTFNRGAAILYMTAEKRQSATTPADISCPIPEFATLDFSRKQINECVKELNRDLAKAYQYVLHVANDWARDHMNKCPMGTQRDEDGNYVDLDSFKQIVNLVKQDYKARETNQQQALDILNN